MDSQNPPDQDTEKTSEGAPESERIKTDDTKATSPATAQQFAEIEKEMTSFERSTLRWAKTAVFMSGLAAIFVCLQWWEMHTSGTDTHNLAVAGGSQATWTQHLADSSKTQSDRTKDLADRMKDQADRTKDLAEQAKIQSGEAKVSADAAKISADTAVSGLRPWIKIIDVKTRGEGPEIPALSFQHSSNWPVDESQTTLQLHISFKNVGRSPTKLSVGFELFLPLWKDGYSNVIYQEKKRFCGEFANKKLGSDPDLEITLFPDETHDWYGGGAALVDSKVVNFFPDRAPVPYILPVVAVCINYQFGNSPTTYQTSALYEVFRRDDRTRYFEVGKGVPESQIFMIRNETSDNSY